MVRKKNQMRKTSGLIFGGAMALQGTQLISRPRTLANLTGTATGFLGIGVAGATANVAWNLVQGPTHKIKKKRKRRK